MVLDEGVCVAAPQTRDPVEFVQQLGTADIYHTSGPNFFNHLHGVMQVLESWNADKDMQLAGLFHSIYGTEGFQGFKLDLSERPIVRGMIGDRAEKTCWLNCVMDRATLDAMLPARAILAGATQPGATPQQELATGAGTVQLAVRTRPEHGGQLVPLTVEEFDLLMTLHLADWLEAVERCAALKDERHQWEVGTAWGYRRKAYRTMADILGGAALECYEQTFAREPQASRHLHQESTPAYDYSNMPAAVKVV